jgi:predicted Zn-dependent peptidase
MFIFGAYKLNKKLINEAEKIIRDYLPTSLKSIDYLKFPKCVLPPFCIKEIINPRLKEGVYLVFLFPGFSIQDADMALRIGLNIVSKIIVGDTPLSLVTKTRREGIYKVDYENLMGQHTGTASFASFVNQGQLLTLIRIIKEHLDELKSQLINEKYLNKIISEKKEKQRLVWRDNIQKYNWIVDDLKNLQPISDINYYMKTLKAITPEFLRSIINNVFDWRKLNLFLIHNQKISINKEEIKKIITS